jgi:transporter family-2 protein
MHELAITSLLLVGSLLAVQAAANVQLSAAMGSPFGASTVQLGIGAALLVTAAAAAGSLGALGLLDEAEPWHLAGGLGSALYITAGIVLFPRVGAVLAVALFIAGQMLASVALDGFGALGVAPDPIGLRQAAGAVAVLTGAALIVRAQGAAIRAPVNLVALGLLAGAALPVQGAVNAQLRADLDAPIAVGAVSFLVAGAAMAIVLGAAVARGARRPRLEKLDAVPWWGWLGGLCGATYVTAVFMLIPEIGAAPVVALTVAGQQLTSVAVDRYGLLRLPKRPISRPRLAGVASLFAGVALITFG